MDLLMKITKHVLVLPIINYFLELTPAIMSFNTFILAKNRV